MRDTKIVCDVGPDGVISTPGIYANLRNVFAKHKGKRIIIGVKRYHENRSVKQNAYYWSVVVRMVRQIFEDQGEILDDEEVHEYLKKQVGKLTRVVMDPDGNPFYFVRDSKTLTTVEWEVFMELCRVWAAEKGYVIPLPNEIL